MRAQGISGRKWVADGLVVAQGNRSTSALYVYVDVEALTRQWTEGASGPRAALGSSLDRLSRQANLGSVGKQVFHDKAHRSALGEELEVPKQIVSLSRCGERRHQRDPQPTRKRAFAVSACLSMVTFDYGVSGRCADHSLTKKVRLGHKIY